MSDKAEHKSKRRGRSRHREDEEPEVPEAHASASAAANEEEELAKNLANVDLDDLDDSESGSEYTDDDDVIDLCDDPNYQVLSAVFETDEGRNVAEILAKYLGKIQKDVHLMATSVHQLIQLSLAAQQAQAAGASDSEED
jgi:hypothetical protein